MPEGRLAMSLHLLLLKNRLSESWPGNLVPRRLFWCPVDRLKVPVGKVGVLLINGSFLFGNSGVLLIR